MPAPPPDTLCYGDCLEWMGRWDDATVDLIYLDPPFNSNANYNVLYARDSAGGAQTRAFVDTWSWDAAAGERLARYEAAAARPAHRAIVGLARILGQSGMLALPDVHGRADRADAAAAEADREPLPPLRRDCLALREDSPGCDLRPAGLPGEITWQRTSSHNDGAQGREQYGRVCDQILFYTKGPEWTWNRLYMAYDQRYIDQFYRHVEEGTGRRYRLGDLTGPGGAAKGTRSTR